MAQKFVVLGSTADGKVEMLASPSVEFSRQKTILEKNSRNEKFAEVQMFMLQPHTRVFHPIATAKAEAEAKAKAEAEANK